MDQQRATRITKHLYHICTMLDQRRRRRADVVQMLYKCFMFGYTLGTRITFSLPAATAIFTPSPHKGICGNYYKTKHPQIIYGVIMVSRPAPDVADGGPTLKHYSLNVNLRGCWDTIMPSLFISPISRTKSHTC